MKTNVVRLNEISNKNAQGYRFIERDPVIEELLFCMDNSDLSDTQIAAYAMTSFQTVRNIRVKTKRPQNWTVDRIMKACGFKRVLMTSRGEVVRR
jgi:hypothetical protein